MSKILLIEDDPFIIDIYNIAFKKDKLDVETISLGQEAIEKIKKIQEGKTEKPGLVLLDLILSDINGIEVLKEIKKNDVTKDIKVFIFSNYANAELPKDTGIKPDKYILKASITPTQLVELVKKEVE